LNAQCLGFVFGMGEELSMLENDAQSQAAMAKFNCEFFHKLIDIT
jgi:hypothetical protein